jgi:hypothetical protein
MISILTYSTERPFQAGGIKLLENIIIQVAFVVVCQQIKNIAWE